MTLRSSDLQSDSDLDSIRNSCDVYSYLIPDSPSQIVNHVVESDLLLEIGINFGRDFNTPKPF